MAFRKRKPGLSNTITLPHGSDAAPIEKLRCGGRMGAIAPSYRLFRGFILAWATLPARASAPSGKRWATSRARCNCQDIRPWLRSPCSYTSTLPFCRLLPVRRPRNPRSVDPGAGRRERSRPPLAKPAAAARRSRACGAGCSRGACGAGLGRQLAGEACRRAGRAAARVGMLPQSDGLRDILRRPGGLGVGGAAGLGYGSASMAHPHGRGILHLAKNTYF